MTQHLLDVQGLKTEFKRGDGSITAVAGVDFAIKKAKC